MEGKIRILGRAIPLWLLVLALVVVSSGAAVGTVLVGKVTGVMPVTVGQALLVGPPVAAGNSTGANLTDVLDNEPQSVEEEVSHLFLPDRWIGTVSDDYTAFEFAVEVDTGDIYGFWLPLKNASNQDLTAQLTLTCPEGIEVEVVDYYNATAANDHVEDVVRTGFSTWLFKLAAAAKKAEPDAETGSADSLFIILQADDTIAPGFYTCEGQLKQVSGTHAGSASHSPVMGIAKGGPAQAVLGTDITYTIVVTNTGTSEATDVTVTDTIPSGMSYRSSSPMGSVSGQTVTWSLGTLGPGASKSLTLILRGIQAGQWTNTARVTCKEGSEDTDQATTKILAPRVDIEKAGPQSRYLNHNAEYTITVTNTGDVQLTGVTVTDTMPDGMSYVSSNPVGTVNGKEVTWALGSMDIGETRDIVLTLRGGQVGSWTDQATVTTDQGVSDTDTATTSVNAVGGVTISSTDTQDPILVGEQTTYIITVTNQGQVAVHGVTVVNTIPDLTSFVSASGPTSYTYTPADRKVTFDPVGTLNPGETLTYNITVKAEAAGAAVDSATLTYDEFPQPVTEQEGTTITQ